MGRIGLEIPTAEAMIAFGQEMAKRLKANAVLALSGDLGAGKTTFVQGLALGLGIDEPICSPTFVTLNLYDGKRPLYHFDLYRLKDETDFLRQGFEEYFGKGGITAIEWPERIASILPKDIIRIEFLHTEQGRVANIC